jgi:hypothetical protein
VNTPLVSPELLEQSRKAQIANILKKQKEHKTLSAREERALAEAASTDVAPPSYVRTYDALAQVLGISRRTITNIKSRHDGSNNPTPAPMPDGRHDVTAWLRFMALNGVSKLDEGGSAADKMSMAELKAFEMRLKCEARELAIAEIHRRLIPAEDIRTKLQLVFSALRTTINNVSSRAAAKLIGLTEYHEIEEVVQKEIDLCLRVISDVRFIEDAAALTPEKIKATLTDEDDEKPAKQPARGRA